jgi:transcription termination factor NusB
MNKPKTKHKEREEIIGFFFSYFLYEKFLPLLMDNLFQSDIHLMLPEQILKIKDMLNHKEPLINKLNNYLKLEHKFERLLQVEKAILFVASYELLIIKLPKKIVINEAVEFAKNYTEENHFQYINAILDKLSKDENLE